MAKSLRELAAERGFITPAEDTQEAQQPKQKADVTQPADVQEVQASGEQAERMADSDNPLEIVFTPDGKEFVLPEQLEEWRKDNPIGAAIYEEELANKKAVERANEIIKNLPFIQFAMDFLRDPDDAFLQWANDLYPEWSRRHFETLLSKVHTQYGDSIDQMRNPATRTREQQQRIIEAVQKEAVQRITLFLDSSYMQALSALEPIVGRYPTYKNEKQTGEPGVTDDSVYSLKEMTVLYFFAKHREIAPESQHALMSTDVEELTAIFNRMDAYFMERTNGGKNEEPEKLYFEFIEHDNRQVPSKRTNAEANNALMTIGERLFVPSDAEYQNAFITSVTGNVGLFAIDEKGKKKQLALNINTEFLRMLAKAIFIDFLNGNKSELGTSLYFPSIARELGYDINHRQADKVKDDAQEVQNGITTRTEARTAFVHGIIKEIDNIWGKLPHDSTEYKLISVLAYNPETEVLHFSSPYLQQLIGALVQKEEAQINGGKKYYLWNCDLLHASAANERNPAAVEMATRILVGVQQRGLTPDAKLKQNKNRRGKDETTVTWSISCKGLIDDCPQIREKLKRSKTTSNRTTTMQRTFKAMYRILKQKTDIFSYYENLKITEIVPTAKSIDAVIVVTHNGGNPKYKRPQLPLNDTAIDEPLESALIEQDVQQATNTISEME